jgi:hypothetical protein
LDLWSDAYADGAAVTPTWLVWSIMPPECLEKIACSSMLDAGRAWAERQFRKGLLPHSGTEVLVRAENDVQPRHSTYRMKITIVNAPAFRASFLGPAYEGNGDPKEGSRG